MRFHRQSSSISGNLKEGLNVRANFRYLNLSPWISTCGDFTSHRDGKGARSTCHILRTSLAWPTAHGLSALYVITSHLNGVLHLVTNVGPRGRIKIVCLSSRVTCCYRAPSMSVSFLELAYIKPRKSNPRTPDKTALNPSDHAWQKTSGHTCSREALEKVTLH